MDEAVWGVWILEISISDSMGAIFARGSMGELVINFCFLAIVINRSGVFLLVSSPGRTDFRNDFLTSWGLQLASQWAIAFCYCRVDSYID